MCTVENDLDEVLKSQHSTHPVYLSWPYKSLIDLQLGLSHGIESVFSIVLLVMFERF